MKEVTVDRNQEQDKARPGHKQEPWSRNRQTDTMESDRQRMCQPLYKKKKRKERY